MIVTFHHRHLVKMRGLGLNVVGLNIRALEQSEPHTSDICSSCISLIDPFCFSLLPSRVLSNTTLLMMHSSFSTLSFSLWVLSNLPISRPAPIIPSQVVLDGELSSAEDIRAASVPSTHCSFPILSL